ncbi:hypothetical protein CBR_g40801 [Chara braunii]|uniref:Uncharacterized protein n=1 Tax=Chara braunii TaxID=69332 RepID=A0A388LUR2_CHABU|nr:hypothetical protein CBR_g40801 [Chara braunii]|eukprot:GBG85989.1 hypothetical protein CBR_g40801 [Chara braunii]
MLFGEVHDDHLMSITDKLLVFLGQVLDDLPLEILSRCDQKPWTTTLVRTLEPHLQWSACTELEEGSYYVPSAGSYLHVDVTDLSTWDPLIRRAPARETSEEEEEEDEEEASAEEEDRESDPDYQGSEDEELGEADSEEEADEEENAPRDTSEPEAAAQRRREAAEGKQPIVESGPSPQLLQGNPALDLEPSREEDEQDGTAAAEGSRSRRHRRSQSPSQSSPVRSTTLRLHQDAGARTSSPVVIPSSP